MATLAFEQNSRIDFSHHGEVAAALVQYTREFEADVSSSPQNSLDIAVTIALKEGKKILLDPSCEQMRKLWKTRMWPG